MAALIDAGVVVASEIATRVKGLASLDSTARERALSWLEAYARSDTE